MLKMRMCMQPGCIHLARNVDPQNVNVHNLMVPDCRACMRVVMLVEQVDCKVISNPPPSCSTDVCGLRSSA